MSEQALKEQTKIRGKLRLQLLDPDGVLKDERLIENTVTTLLKNHVANQMASKSDVAIGYMAVGTGSGQGAASSGLANSLDRRALTSKTQGEGGNANNVVYVGTWAAGQGTGAITEAGIMRANNNTSLMTYADFAVINKGAGDSLVITWTVTYGS